MPAPQNELTIIAGLVGRLIRYAASRGLDPRELCRIVGVTPEILQTQGAYVPLRPYFDLFAHIATALDDPGVAIHLAETITLEDLYVMGFAVMTAQNGREAFERAVRYARLITNSTHWSMHDDNGEVTVRLSRPLPLDLGHQLSTESAIAEFVHCARQSTGANFSPTRVAFRHAAPRDIRAHERLFRCPIEFGAEHNEFTLSIDLMTLVPSRYSPALSTFFVQHAETLLRELEGEQASVATRVRKEIIEALPSGPPSLEQVARRLGMSERSLRRYLGEEQTSFSQILDEVRHERARALLRSSPASIGEIGFLLGFSDVSAFSRAFKKWSGTSPAEFRSSAAAT